MTRLLIALAGLLLMGSVQTASAQMALIQQHRQWADSIYGKPSELAEEELIRQASIIITYNLQEDSGYRLLAWLAKDVPELNEYVSVSLSGEPDMGKAAYFTAFEALTDYARSKFPDSVLPDECMLRMLYNGIAIKNMEGETGRFVESLEKKYGSRTAPREGRAILANARMLHWMNRQFHSDIDNPATYPEIFSLEKEIFDIYPLSSDEISLLRAETYNNLAIMKNMPTNDFVAFLGHSVSGSIPGMEYMLVGDADNYPLNTRQLYLKAIEVGEKALNPGHPLVQDIRHSEACYRINYMNPDEQCLQDKKDHYNYIKFYYPADSFEVAYGRLVNHYHNAFYGLPDSDGPFVEQSLQTMEAYLGKDGVHYLQSLGEMAFMYMMIDPTDTEFLERYLQTLEEIGYGPESDKVNYYLCQLYGALYDMVPEEAYAGLEKVLANYVNYRSPSLLSVVIGRAIGSIYATKLSNYELGSGVLQMAIYDLEKMAASEAAYLPMLWCYRLELAILNGMHDNDRIDTEFSSLLDRIDKDSFAGKEMVAYFIRRQWAESKALTRDYAGGITLLKQNMDILSDAPDKYIDNAGCLAIYSQFVGMPSAEIDPYINKAIGMIDDVMRGGYYGQISCHSVSLIADYLCGEGRFDESIRLTLTRQEMYEKLHFTTNTIEYLNILQDLCTLYQSAGRLNDASRLNDRIAAVVEDAFVDAPSPDLLDCLWNDYYNSQPRNPAHIFDSIGRLGRILNLTEALYEISGRDNGIRYNYLARYMGEYLQLQVLVARMVSGTEQMVENLSEEQQELFRQQVASYRATADNVAGFAEEMVGEFRGYDPRYASNPCYITLADGLINYYAEIAGNVEKAVAFKEEMAEGILTPNHRFTTFLGLAQDHYILGNYDRFCWYLQRGEEMVASIRDLTDPDFINLNTLRLWRANHEGDYDNSLKYARDLFARQKATLDGNFQLMTVREQEDYMNQNGDPAFNLACLLQHKPREISGEVYDAIIYRTGMQLRSQRSTRDALQRSDDPAVKQMLDSLANVEILLGNVDLSYTGTNQEQYNRNLSEFNSLKRKANRLEQALLDATAHLRRGSLADVKWQQIRERLSDREAAIEFLFSDTCVMALVIRNGSEAPQAVALMPTEELWNMLKPLHERGSASMAKRLYRSKNTDLYLGLWQPLEEHLEGVERVYFSVPGMLSALSFNAFSTPEGNTVFDRYELVQLTTTGQLVFDHPQLSTGSIAIMGDILYAPDQEPVSAEEALAREVALDSDDEFHLDLLADDDVRGGTSYFAHLPFTAFEMDEISELFPQGAVTSVRRLDATEEKLHELVEMQPDIIHLATHGYYVSGEDKIIGHPFFKKVGTGSMQRSGFALAGAEGCWRGLSEEDSYCDGIVTAGEVAMLDLKHTGLVALSACETALGDTNFEGVFGLQRGFKQAGVESLLVSLWSVSDKSTALFMTTFYESLLGGNTRYQSWRNAVMRVRHEYPQPYYWAPFILLDGV